MQIDKLKHQHIDILRRVAALRTLTHATLNHCPRILARRGRPVRHRPSRRAAQLYKPFTRQPPSLGLSARQCAA